jgi:hypothetical protein
MTGAPRPFNRIIEVRRPLAGPQEKLLMEAIVIEHVRVSELPEAWRAKLGAQREARVTVRIETEAEAPAVQAPEERGERNPLFGMWRDREDMADVEAYVRKLRAPRF